VGKHNCLGVLLAHHQGDVIETVFQRLLRGSGVAGLGGIRCDTCVHGVRVVRPLLDVRSQKLREYLRSIGQSWREDASNESLKYGRNRVRRLLRDFPILNSDINALRSACDAVHQWIEANATVLAKRFAARQLADLPALLANESARRWLVEVGCPPGELEPAHLEAMVAMACDASTPPRYTFPGRVMIARKSGWIERIA
jgi:tRNA(Ile)-lysidine synthase TilS/MesJ